jgi:hypothetical protein
MVLPTVRDEMANVGGCHHTPIIGIHATRFSELPSPETLVHVYLAVVFMQVINNRSSRVCRNDKVVPINANASTNLVDGVSVTREFMPIQ